MIIVSYAAAMDKEEAVAVAEAVEEEAMEAVGEEEAVEEVVEEEAMEAVVVVAPKLQFGTLYETGAASRGSTKRRTMEFGRKHGRMNQIRLFGSNGMLKKWRGFESQVVASVAGIRCSKTCLTMPH